jgi:hypothetical protein
LGTSFFGASFFSSFFSTFAGAVVAGAAAFDNPSLANYPFYFNLFILAKRPFL